MAYGGKLMQVWQVVDYSPSLADKVARNTAVNTIEEMSEEITQVIKIDKS